MSEGGNLNRKFIAVFVFFGFFAVLLATMPTEFIILGVDADVEGKEARDYFSAQDVTVYNYTLTINLTNPGSEKEDFGLPEGQKLEFWWGTEYVGEGYPNNYRDFVELRHLTPGLFGWWWDWHNLEPQEPYRSQVKYPRFGLYEEEVVTTLFDEEANSTYCEFACDHITAKVFILTYNQSWTLQESWDNNKLKIYTSYKIDWSRTGTSMWTVLMQLLSFQNPNLGIPGVGGTILGVGVSLFLWASIAIMAYAIITAVIPFIPGWKGG